MTREYLGAGWDCEAWLVDHTFVERTARRPDVEPWLRTETTLLPWLAPRLPVAVPVPTVVAEHPLTTRHRLVPGTPLAHATHPVDATELGIVVGTFLTILHDLPLDRAIARGLPGPERTIVLRDTAWARFDDEVVPRLPARARPWLAARLDALRDAPATALVHGDLSAEHVLVADDGAITGIIDWADARAGDPAKDLLWPLHGAGPDVARAFARAYDPDAELVTRAAAWRDVAPCYTVTHGLDTGDDALVGSTLDALAHSADRAVT